MGNSRNLASQVSRRGFCHGLHMLLDQTADAPGTFATARLKSKMQMQLG
jgi:hypothetical protein